MKKYSVTVNGSKYEVIVEESAIGAASPAPAQKAAPAPAASAPAPAPAPATVSADGTKVEAPLPGTILKIVAQAGKQVKAGETLCILEAMKMENEIASPADGTVAQIAVGEGASVNTGDLLFVIS